MTPIRCELFISARNVPLSVMIPGHLHLIILFLAVWGPVVDGNEEKKEYQACVTALGSHVFQLSVRNTTAHNLDSVLGSLRTCNVTTVPCPSTAVYGPVILGDISVLRSSTPDPSDADERLIECAKRVLPNNWVFYFTWWEILLITVGCLIVCGPCVCICFCRNAECLRCCECLRFCSPPRSCSCPSSPTPAPTPAPLVTPLEIRTVESPAPLPRTVLPARDTGSPRPLGMTVLPPRATVSTLLSGVVSPEMATRHASRVEFPTNDTVYVHRIGV